jgi:hypothetical protein
VTYHLQIRWVAGTPVVPVAAAAVGLRGLAGWLLVVAGVFGGDAAAAVDLAVVAVLVVAH